MKMDYKVCILAAGVSRTLGELTKNVNAAILPVNYKASISYAIEKFPSNFEIVIAVGHQKQHLMDYLAIAHPDRNFKYVEVDKYMGPGSGTGYSLLKCKPYLQCPFILFTPDTIVSEDVPPPDKNWVGIAPVRETEKYCTIKIKNDVVYQLDDKIKTNNKFALIGLSGIKDYDAFWASLEKNSDSSRGEVRDIEGFKALIERRLIPIGFTWFDTGSLQNYIETNKNFLGDEKSFDFSKTDEFLYFVNGRVIKYFADQAITNKRVERAAYLNGLCPKIDIHKGNFYSYKKIEGDTLYNVINSQVLRDFLTWAKSNLWKEQKLSGEELDAFNKACVDFYRIKTMKRINSFYEKNNIYDSQNIINGINVPTLKSLLDKVDWNYICSGLPGQFHGDLTVGNVLATRDNKTNLQKFLLLDWRHDFGGLAKTGDIYYDLAKFYKGIILSDDLIKQGMFTFDISGSSVYYDYIIKRGLIEAKEEYESFIIENNYDLHKVKVLTAIALLNMSPLHNYPFNFLVYFLGKNILYKVLGDRKNG